MNRPEPAWRQHLRFFLGAGPALFGWFFGAYFVLPKIEKTWESIDGSFTLGAFDNIAALSRGILGNFTAAVAFAAFILISTEIIARSRPEIRPWVIDILVFLINLAAVIGLAMLSVWAFLAIGLAGRP